MKRQSVREGVFTVAGVLSSDECIHLVALAERHGFEIATINTRHGAEVDQDVRNNERVILDDQALANRLWLRIRSAVPSLLAGRQARGVNERFRFYRYVPGQTVEVTLALMYYQEPDILYEDVVPGATFTLREGARIVGYGTVLSKAQQGHAGDARNARA
jgi:hypothetical protein